MRILTVLVAALSLASLAGVAEATSHYSTASTTIALDGAPNDYWPLCLNHDMSVGRYEPVITADIDYGAQTVTFRSTDGTSFDDAVFVVANGTNGDLHHHNAADLSFGTTGGHSASFPFSLVTNSTGTWGKLNGHSVSLHYLNDDVTVVSTANIWRQGGGDAEVLGHYYYNGDNEYRGNTIERTIPEASTGTSFQVIDSTLGIWSTLDGPTDTYTLDDAAGTTTCEYGQSNSWDVPTGIGFDPNIPITVLPDPDIPSVNYPVEIVDLNDYAYHFGHALTFTADASELFTGNIGTGVIMAGESNLLSDMFKNATVTITAPGTTDTRTVRFAYDAPTFIKHDEDHADFGTDVSDIDGSVAADYFRDVTEIESFAWEWLNTTGSGFTTGVGAPVTAGITGSDPATATITMDVNEDAHTYGERLVLELVATRDNTQDGPAEVRHQFQFKIEPVDDPPVQDTTGQTIQEDAQNPYTVSITAMVSDGRDLAEDGTEEAYVYLDSGTLGPSIDVDTTGDPADPEVDCSEYSVALNPADTALIITRPDDCENDAEVTFNVAPAGRTAETATHAEFTYDLTINAVPDNPKYHSETLEVTEGMPVYAPLDVYDPDESDHGKDIGCTAPPGALPGDLQFSAEECTLYGNIGIVPDASYDFTTIATSTGGDPAVGTSATLTINVADIADTTVILNAGQQHSFDIREYITAYVDGINANGVDVDGEGAGTGWNIGAPKEADYEIEAWWSHDDTEVDFDYSISNSTITFVMPDAGEVGYPDGYVAGTDRIIVRVSESGADFQGAGIQFDREFYFSINPSILLLEDDTATDELEGETAQAAGTTKEVSSAGNADDYAISDPVDSAIRAVAVTSESGTDPAFDVTVHRNATELAYGEHPDQSSADVLGDITTWDGTPIIFLPGAVEIDAPDTDCPCLVELGYNYAPLYNLGVGSVRDAVASGLLVFHFEDGEWSPLETVTNSTAGFDAAPHDAAGENTITARTETFSPFAIGMPNPHAVFAVGSEDDWKRKPTFGVSWKTGDLLVRDGFTFNDRTLDVTDNWHTEFDRTSAVIGSENRIITRSYAPDGHDMFSLALGVPRIGMQQAAEAEILVDLERDNDADAGFAVKSVAHNQEDPVIDEEATTVSLLPASCGGNEETLCLEIDVAFRTMAPLKHEVLAISAIDERNRITTTYINDGVFFEGASLLPPATASHFAKRTSQDAGGTILLVQPDRRYNSWTDQDGHLWEKNPHGTWIRVTHPPVPERSDAPVHVLTRHHSDFAGVAGEEAGRATSSWDAGSVAGTLGPAFAYDLPIQHVPRLERLAPELEAEHERATMALERPSGDMPRIAYDAGLVTASGAVGPGTGGLVLHVFEGLSLGTFDVPVEADGSFEASFEVGGGFTYAYLESGGAVLAHH